MGVGPADARDDAYGVSFEPIGKQPIVLLKTADDEKFLPIWIGHAEAAAILMKLQGASPPRPMTHDLFTRRRLRAPGRDRQGDGDRASREHVLRAHHDRPGRSTRSRSTRGPPTRSRSPSAATRRSSPRTTSSRSPESSSRPEDEDQPRLVTASNLADLDPAEFRQFLETVTPEEFATSLEEMGSSRKWRTSRRRRTRRTTTS